MIESLNNLLSGLNIMLKLNQDEVSAYAQGKCDGLTMAKVYVARAIKELEKQQGVR